MDLWRLTFYMQEALTDEGDITLVVEEGEKYSVYRELTNDIKGGSFLLVSDIEGEEYLIPKDKIHHATALSQDNLEDMSAVIVRATVE